MAHFEKLTFLFPMRDEEAAIERLIRETTRVGHELVGVGEIQDYEILLIDDSSSDRTHPRAAAWARRNSRLHLVRHSASKGLGASVQTGFRFAEGDLILYTAADLPFDLSEVRQGCQVLRRAGADALSAYRRTPDAGIGSLTYDWLVRGVFGIPFRDAGFSYKLVRRDALEGITITSQSSFVDTELLVQLHSLGRKVVQYGVDPRPRGGSAKLGSFAGSWSTLGDMARLRRRLSTRRESTRSPS